MLFSALFAVIGHAFPVWLRFRGGKGVATGLGGALAVTPIAVFGCIFIFGLVFATKRYVSLASIIAAACYPLFALWLDFGHPFWWAAWPAIPMSCVIIAKHRSNIRRLIAGTEDKFGRKPKGPLDVERSI